MYTMHAGNRAFLNADMYDESRLVVYEKVISAGTE